MRDLQHRLVALGFDASGDEPGTFGATTTRALRSFQHQRGLSATGECDATTWEALVEAGWRLGDRPLYLAGALLRGDDVADLQRRLNAIGFDAGRVDGIFGRLTERALLDFQRNAGLVADAICGPATVGALFRLGDRDRAAASIVDVRERERFRCLPRSLAGRSVVVAHSGGVDALTSSIARLLAAGGASALVVQHPDGSEQASQANGLAADVLVGIALTEMDAGWERRGSGNSAARPAGSAGARISYYGSPAGWESKGGMMLASLLGTELQTSVDGMTSDVAPMSVPLLRETRMPAVMVELWPPSVGVEHGGTVAACVYRAVEGWITQFAADS